MAEKDTIFSNSLKYTGIFKFTNFYKFCYDWINDEIGASISEDKYGEKLVKGGTEKEIEVEWKAEKKLTDYFKFEMSVKFEVKMLKEVEITIDNKKVKTNDGEVKIKVKGVMVRDYEGKFEKTPSLKFLRSVYEKWVIPSRIDQFGEKIAGDCEGFLEQTKSWLNLEGKK